MDLRGNIPGFIHVSYGKMDDANALKSPIPAPAAIYVMDRACLDLKRVCGLHNARPFFVTRAKSNPDHLR